MTGWLLFKNRRPGMIGAAVSFGGRTPYGSADLKRTPSGWQFITADRRDDVTEADALALIGTGAFFPRTVDVVPDLAELLFKEAVNQAETSLLRIDAAVRHVREPTETDFEQNPVPWVLATGELDRSVRASISSIVLAIAAAEAQVNRWADLFEGWSDNEDRVGVAEKCKALAARVGHPLTLGKGPYQQLHKAVKRRNTFVHSKPVPEPVPLTGARSLRPGASMSIEARATCLAVRTSLVDLARRLDTPLPPYLAYCPPAAPTDDAAWRSASLMTGTRQDPDFSTVSKEPAASDHSDDT